MPDPNAAAYLRSRPGAPHNAAMSEREPALLGDRSGAPAAPAAPSLPVADTDDIPELVRARRESPTVYVVGFWRRAVAALADAIVVVPLGLLVTLIASKL